MPRVHSVSEIKVMLSGILGSYTELKNIKVRGKISPLRGTYFLSDGEIGIGCFIPPQIKTQFSQLLSRGTPVIVHGNIRLYTDPGFNEYEINVNKIMSEADEIVAFSMSQVERQLLKIIADRFESIDVRARGRINRVSGLPDNVLSLKDPDGSAILCQLHNNNLPNQDREEVFIRGKICNFSARNRIQYRIDVAEIDPCPLDYNIAQCQCPRCDRCGNAPQCNRPREIANFESCARCLPRPPDELYELCPECYAISPDHETEVTNAVYDYLNGLGVNGFSPSTESQIQFGTRNGIADVVLTDVNGSFAVIAECKGAGYIGHGIEQLKSYLSATDTRFGVFANRVDKSQWKFYENRRGNCIPKIDCSEFEAGVVEGVANRERLRDEIANLNGEIAELENQKSELHTAIEHVSQTKHNLTERSSYLTQQIETLENYKSELHKEIHRKLDNLLEEKMQKLERPLSDLKIELQKRGIINWLKNLFSKENK